MPAKGLYIAVFGGIALLAMASGAVVYVVSGLTAPIKETANRFDAAIAASDTEAAYAEMSGAMKAKYSAEEIQSILETATVWGKDGDFLFTSRGFKNSSGYAEGRWTGPDGTVIPVKLSLVWENEAWRIISFRFGAGD